MHGVLYCKWKIYQVVGVCKHMYPQLVLPSKLVKSMLEGLHSALVGVLHGETKLKVCARCYRPGHKTDVDMS